MGRGNNYVGYNNGGIVDSIGCTVNNIFYYDDSFTSGGSFHGKGNEYWNFLALFMDENDACRETVTKRLDEAYAEAYATKQFPIWVQITELLNVCARIVYFNEGSNDEAIRKLINQFFTIACISLNFKYRAQIVKIGLDYFFEMNLQ